MHSYTNYMIVRLNSVPSSEVPRSPVRPLEVLTARTGSPTSNPGQGVACNLSKKIIFFFGMDRSQISLLRQTVFSCIFPLDRLVKIFVTFSSKLRPASWTFLAYDS